MSDLKQTWECIAELKGHLSWIYGVLIISEEMLASVSGSEILFWNLNTKEIDATLKKHTDTILSLSLSPGSKILASGSLDKTVKLWDLAKRELICTLAERKDPIHSIAFSPNGKLLASGGENKYKTVDGKKTTIYLWNIDRKELIHTFSGHDLRVNTLAFSPDSQILASGSNDNKVRLWDINSDKQLHILEGHSSNISKVAFTSDGESLISSGGGGIKVWNVKTGELQQNFADQSDYIKCFAIDPTNRFLAFELREGIEIWNFKNREKLQYLDFRWSISMNFSPDGKFFASGDATAFTEDRGVVKIWRVPELESIKTPNSDLSELAIERQKNESEGYFDPENLEDARQRIITSIVRRQGQAEFKRKLINAYSGRCPITDCDLGSVIEAAHIVPYKGTETNHPTNGLPLRADIHILFDLHLLSIRPNTYDVVIAPELINTCYEYLCNRKMTLPKSKQAVPNKNALNKHYEIFLKKHGNNQSLVN